ncbi:hypothetical protein FSP39_023472 [Pinctada imbricata]|uniref:Uncharacterized protein n=1 Tax=Pinctada imbricata TaxID=66713 RepID=A0AA88XUA1_PINIB|nr:hypothetical protein FSP39_023472 [Pinctada imbricata]
MKTYTVFFLDTGGSDTTFDIAHIGNPASIEYAVGTETTGMTSWPAMSASMIQQTSGTTLVSDRALTITATLSSDQDLLSVYGIAHGEAGSDSFTIFENSNLGTEYLVMTFCDVIGVCQFAVAATEETNIEISLPRQRNFSNPTCNVTYNSTVYLENDLIIEVLGAGTVIQIQASCDLTGTLITADKSVAVFSGSHSNVIGWGNTKDFMMEQLVPVEYCGTEHIIYPYYNNTSGDVISIVSVYNNTEVRIVGYGNYILLEERQFLRRRIESDRPTKVWASKKVCIAQYIIDYEKEASAMLIVSPIEQFISQVATNMENQVHIIAESILFEASDIMTVGSTVSHELSNVVDVKKTKYAAGELVVSGSDDFILTQVDGLQFGGYYVQETSPNRLMATSIGFQFQNQTIVTKSHVPGDDVDNDGDGSLDEDSCKHCTEGNELEPYDITGSCQPCQIGWYKNYSSADSSIGNDDRWRCTQCPVGKTTFEIGTIDPERCIDICLEGEELEPYNSSGQCQPCQIGWYKDSSSQDVNLSQDERWRCKICPGSKTTNKTGVTTSAMCYDYCAEGLEWSSYLVGGTVDCQPCQIGWYKDLSGESTSLPEADRWLCKRCPNNKTTIDHGSNSSVLCLAQCSEGEELEPFDISGTCQPCQIGWYKTVSSDNTTLNKEGRWRCTPCPNGKTTFGTGTVSPERCFDICAEGYEFDNVTETCRACRKGFYKEVSSINLQVDLAVRWYCQSCPYGQTTNFTGTTDSNHCIGTTVKFVLIMLANMSSMICMCPCSKTAGRSNIANMSSSEQAAILNELAQELKTDTKTLSSTVRKKTSASDSRPSSQAFGAIGIIMLTVPFTFLILIDIPTLKSHAQMFVRNVRTIIRGE